VLVEYISNLVSDFFFLASPLARMVFIFLFAYGEGLPVIGTLLPGGTIALLVGSLSAEGFIKPLSAALLITIGSFLGDITGFFIGKKIGKWRWIGKFVHNENYKNSWDIFDRNFALIVVFGKLIPVVRSTPSFFAGARNIKFSRYVFFSFLGSLLWSVVGIYGGNLLSRTVGNLAIPIILGILVISVIATLVKSLRKKNPKN
jgi:membrane-associated protein